jgi:hypothetical protein
MQKITGLLPSDTDYWRHAWLKMVVQPTHRYFLYWKIPLDVITSKTSCCGEISTYFRAICWTTKHEKLQHVILTMGLNSWNFSVVLFLHAFLPGLAILITFSLSYLTTNLRKDGLGYYHVRISAPPPPPKWTSWWHRSLHKCLL